VLQATAPSRSCSGDGKVGLSAMTDWLYDMRIPDDVVVGAELEDYKRLAVATWHTAAEASGGMPGEPVVTLVELGPENGRPDPITGTVPVRAWRVSGPVV
jgi:hypothetical protein